MRRSTSSPWAPPSANEPPSCCTANKYQDYLLLHGIGVEMAEALAELWHRRIREGGVGDRGGGRGVARRTLPSAVPGGPLLLGVPGMSRARGQRHRRRSPRCRPHRYRGRRGHGLAVPPRADHQRPDLSTPRSQVLRGPIGRDARHEGAIMRSSNMRSSNMGNSNMTGIDRRSFLKLGAAGAGMAALGTTAAACAPDPSPVHRVLGRHRRRVAFAVGSRDLDPRRSRLRPVDEHRRLGSRHLTSDDHHRELGKRQPDHCQ